MWKYSAVWLFNAGFVVLATLAQPGPKVVGTEQDPITAGYNGAQLISQLTDRGLWLFFLFIILAASYWNNRSKEREINRLQERQDANQERLFETLTSVDKMLERIERKLDE